LSSDSGLTESDLEETSETGALGGSCPVKASGEGLTLSGRKTKAKTR